MTFSSFQNLNYLRQQKDEVFFGMSLEGLSAFDIMYNHPNHFNKVGVFSGSFWGRKKAYIKGDKRDRSRIILYLIKNKDYVANQKF